MATGDKVLASRFNAIITNINTVKNYVGYKQLDYIQTTGTQYIDTDITVFDQSNFKIEYIAAFTAVNYNYNNLWSSTSDTENYQAWVYSSGKLAYKWGSSTAVQSSTTMDTSKHTYTFYKNSSAISMSVDSTQVSSSTNSGTLNSPLRLFRKGSSYGKAKIYEIKIYVNETLTYDLVPAKRVADNVLGLFDIKKQKFYENSGTGTFTAGSETETISVPIGQTWQGTVSAGTKITAASVNQLINNVIALSDYVETNVGNSSSCTTNNCSGNHSGYTASSNSHTSSCSCNGRCDSNQTYCPSAN